jgi:hypothetical protein
MKKLVTAMAALLGAAACATSITGTAQGHETGPYVSAVQDVSCEIEVRSTRHGAEFTALAHAYAWSEGAYELVLTKIDSSGSSDILQSGEFALGSSETEELGVAEISLERGARYRARLTLWSDGEEVCSAVERS